MSKNIQDFIQYRLKRSQETLVEAEMMANVEHWNACVNRLYYACFYSINALLIVIAHNLASSKHTGVKSLFNRHFVKPGHISKELGAFYNELFENRQEGDYQDFAEFEPDAIDLWIFQAKTFIQTIENLIKQSQECNLNLLDP